MKKVFTYADLYLTVHKKITDMGADIGVQDVKSVVRILFEELLKDLKKKKTFVIDNFGRFMLKKLPPRGFFNVRTGKVEKSKGIKVLRFQLSRVLKKKLAALIDIEKTFDNIEDEYGKTK